MFSAPRALGHTYYLPSCDRIIGPAAAELGDFLRRVWTARRDCASTDRSDGVSVWSDPQGCVWVAVVHAREVDLIADVGVLQEARRALEVVPLLTRRVA